MTESKIQMLSEQEAIERIVKTVTRAKRGTAPFALVLGSGFSHGLVPTTKEVVEENLPLWMWSLNNGVSYEDSKQLPPAERTSIAKAFWTSFLESNRKHGCDLELDTETGLPKDVPAAYKAAFTSKYFEAVGEPAVARRFQRALMQLDKPRLNAAHFLLASLLGVQPGMTRESGLFKARAAFSRLILTTNFDPFLQTALQAVNRLYFMSDTPELGISDEIYDEQTDAIHLVYLHGSIHRRAQAASDNDIRQLKEKNARTLAPVLKRHGVIVLGYSGWDDAIVEALDECDSFDHLLYWCGLEADPLATGAFGEKVPGILRKSTALYVKIDDADSFMFQLFKGLVNRMPRLLSNPIGQVRELLTAIALQELDNKSKPLTQDGSISRQLSNSGIMMGEFYQAKESTLQLLKEAEQVFFGIAADATKKAQQLLSSARLAVRLGNTDEALKLTHEALALPCLAASIRADVVLLRAAVHFYAGSTNNALDELTQIIELPGTAVEQVARALINRGFLLGQMGETEQELTDYTRVIEQLPGAAVEHVAKALFNRGATLGERGETDKALADYTRVIEQLSGAPVEQVAQALNNRGVTWGRKGERDKALADFTRVIEQLPGATADQVAAALYNRGVRWGEKSEREKELADYTRVIDQLPGAPVELVAKSLNNRGVRWAQKGETDKALADYTRVIEQLPGAPVEQIAQALNIRGVTWVQKGETDKALADFTWVIEQLSDAPGDQVAQALNNRGWCHYQRKAYSTFLADIEAALSKQPTFDTAAFNLGLALLACGRDSDALVAYQRAGETFPQGIEIHGLKDLAEAQESWLAEERAYPLIQLLRSLKK